VKLFIAISLILSIVIIIALLIPQLVINSQSTSVNENLTNSQTTESINLSPMLKFEKIKTIPNEIHVGEKFSISATVVNTGSYPVTLIANL
jgi:spore coat protein U-like protein